MSETLDGGSEQLDSAQRAVLHDNLEVVIETGLGRLYTTSLKAEASYWQYLADIGDPAADTFRKTAENMRQAALGEQPFAFSLETSNMAAAVKMVRVDSQTGREIANSSLQIGLVGGLAGEGRVSSMSGFNPTQLAKAIEQLRKQKQAGLVYGFKDGSGFLKDY